MRLSAKRLHADGLIILLPLLAASPAMGQAPPGPAEATATHLRVATPQGSVALHVEIAATATAHARGLMGRTALAPDAGMLFVYRQAQAADVGFWMYRTRIALDVAFLDRDGRILAIVAMAPCPSRVPSRCPRYEPGTSYWAALEVNHGFFARHGIRIGDRVVLP